MAESFERYAVCRAGECEPQRGSTDEAVIKDSLNLPAVQK